MANGEDNLNSIGNNGSSQETHLLASKELIGEVRRIEKGKCAEVVLIADEKMQVDAKGLIHGGFTFGLADYAAMVTVNDPFVVLVYSNVKFVKPVVVGDKLSAKSKITEVKGTKKTVLCEVFNQHNIKVFEGEFFCVSLEKHVLETSK